MAPCEHPVKVRKPDLLHGAYPHNMIEWCSHCGAYRHKYVFPEGDPQERQPGEESYTAWQVPTLGQALRRLAEQVREEYPHVNVFMKKILEELENPET